MTILFEPDRYRHHLDGYNLPEDHKLNLMTYVWSIMEGFVDRAFGQSSEQIIARDKLRKKRDHAQSEIAPCQEALTQKFNATRLADERTTP